MFFFWFVIKSILAGVIGNSFYKWFQGTKTGKWFDKKLEGIMNKVTNKHDEAVAKKSPQIDMFEKRK
jgi:hypothetical protein